MSDRKNISLDLTSVAGRLQALTLQKKLSLALGGGALVGAVSIMAPLAMPAVALGAAAAGIYASAPMTEGQQFDFIVDTVSKLKREGARRVEITVDKGVELKLGGSLEGSPLSITAGGGVKDKVTLRVDFR